MTKKKKVGLSDGHGMRTFGKRTPEFTDGTTSPDTGKNFMHENEFNRAVEAYVAEHLKRCGIDVLHVAPGDDDIPLATRTKLANEQGVDIYVSIHANAMTGKWGTARGIETFYHTASKEGRRLAEHIHKELVKGTDLVDRGLKNGNHLYEIRTTKMPSVLVECGFMDNLREAKLLLSDSYRRECAEEIARGICAYFGIRFVSEPSKEEFSRSAIDTTKGIGVVEVLVDGLTLREGPGATHKMVRKLKKGDVFYAYGAQGSWYDLGGGWTTPGPDNEFMKVTLHPRELFRVRNTWSEVLSQVGAFYDLQSAKLMADEKGLSVFDASGDLVYKGKKEDDAKGVGSEEEKQLIDRLVQAKHIATSSDVSEKTIFSLTFKELLELFKNR